MIWAALAAAASLAGADCAPKGGLSFICGPVGAEDVAAIPGSRWLVSSGLDLGGGGRLFLIDRKARRSQVLTFSDAATSPGCPGPPDPTKMSTDGLTLRPGPGGRHTLYVANHGDRRAIEMFRIDARRSVPTASWVGCAMMPTGTLPNAVTTLWGGRLIVTSFHDPDDQEALEKMARQEPTGSVWEWRPGSGFQRLDVGPISGANGVEVSPDERTLYVSAWSASKLVAIDLKTLRRREIPLDFLPDNIKRGPGGTLLVGGQKTSVPSIAACNGPRCPQDWKIVRVDPRTGRVTPLVARHGDGLIDYACTGLEVGGVLYITARGDRRIGAIPISALPSLD